MNNDIPEEMVHHLRDLLKLDVLPKIEDQSIREKITSQVLGTANETKQVVPQLLAIGGGPGSGKNYFYENLKIKGLLPKNSIIHDPDLVMQLIPQYQIDSSINPVNAFERWELPALQLANEILLKALIARYNIIYIRSFALSDSLKFVHLAKMAGFKIDMYMIVCDLRIAISRAQSRGKISNRHIPIETIIQRHEAVSNLLPDIIDVSDNCFFYENNKDGLEPMLKESSLV